jgi:sialic acid synthase SpsE
MEIKIISEVSSNHAGDLELAKQFIRISSGIEVDYVKFQSSRYEDLVDKTKKEVEWIKKASLSDEAHVLLIEECRKFNINFLTTCFSLSRVDFLASLGLEEIKVASPDLMSFSMIEKLASRFKHLIISAGMHSIRDIREAIKFLIRNKINATLLHAVSIYPTPLNKTFMSKFLWLKDNYPHVGYSNHTPNIEPIKFAMANGAEIIEAHMKLGENGPGRTTSWDILPADFKQIIEYRNMLKEVLGDKRYLEDENFLFPEEIEAKKKFIGRWGDNK